MNYDEAIEITEQAHMHSMNEISESEKVIEEMKRKAEMWDTLKHKLIRKYGKGSINMLYDIEINFINPYGEIKSVGRNNIAIDDVKSLINELNENEEDVININITKVYADEQ